MVEIDHVIVLVLENRSFDHMLGYLQHPDAAFDGAGKVGWSIPGWDRGQMVAASSEAKAVLPVDPDHSHDAVLEQLGVRRRRGRSRTTNVGFVKSYERKGRGLSAPSFGGLFGPLVNWWVGRAQRKTSPISGRGPLVMRCQAPERVPVLSTLALGFAVCTRWFCSVPGETWPNRNFLHAATSDGETNIDVRFYTNPTVFELLEDAGRDWRIYHDDTPQVWAFEKLWDSPDRLANWFQYSSFAEHVAAGDLPAYSFLEPNQRPPVHTLDHAPLIGDPDVSNSQHPGNNMVTNRAYDAYDSDVSTDFSRGEALIADVYEALRANPTAFARSLLLITYDEHGGLADHVPPPDDVPAPDTAPSKTGRIFSWLLHRKATAFDFRMLGPRVPAVVISPHIPAATVHTGVHDHASVPSTLRTLFAPQADPLSERDRWAQPIQALLTLDAPRTDLPDLSHHTTAAAQRVVPRGTTPAAVQPVGTAAVAEIPDHYRPLVELSEKVGDRLQAQGRYETPLALGAEPLGLRPGDPGREVTSAFARAAANARVQPSSTPSPSDPPT